MADQVRGVPSRLEGYTQATTPTLGPTVAGVEEYSAAIKVFNAAEPNDLGTYLIDHGENLEGDLDALGDLDAKPAAFAFALRQLDRGEGFFEILFKMAGTALAALRGEEPPTEPPWLSTSDMELFDALVDAKLGLPSASDQAVLDGAASELGREYAARLREAGLDDPSASQWTQDMADQHGELAELFADMDRLSQWNPEFADALVDDLGSEGVHQVVNRMRVQQTAVGYAGLGPTAVQQDLLEPFARMLGVATRAGGASQTVLDGIVEGDSTNVGLLLATGGYDRRFLEPAFDRVWDEELSSAHLDSLALVVMDGDARVGALRGLARDDGLSWEKVSSDEDFGHALLFDNFNDDGRAAGSVLTAGLHDYVVAHPEHLEKSKELYAEIVKRVNDEGDEFLGFGDDLNGGARIALAQVSTLHLDDIAQAAGENGYDGPIQTLERDDLKDFFKAILSEDGSEDILAEGLGVYTGLQFAAGSKAAAELDGDAEAYHEYTQHAGELAALFGEAAEAKVGDDAAKTDFLIKAGQATSTTLVVLGLAAAPISAGTSTVAGAGSSLAISSLMEKIPRPSFDREAERSELERMYVALGASSFVAHDANVASLPEPSQLDAATRARLRDEEFVQAVVNGDPVANKELDEILNRVESLESKALEARQEAWLPIIEHLGD